MLIRQKHQNYGWHVTYVTCGIVVHMNIQLQFQSKRILTLAINVKNVVQYDLVYWLCNVDQYFDPSP